mmetsp:Transcript_32451/g.58653  ORF Transcript_32451/g.58653 Transcript_32451/m.58653 type:complete len:208 (+) Transcript_32451:2047-2670(+)
MPRGAVDSYRDEHAGVERQIVVARFNQLCVGHSNVSNDRVPVHVGCDMIVIQTSIDGVRNGGNILGKDGEDIAVGEDKCHLVASGGEVIVEEINSVGVRDAVDAHLAFRTSIDELDRHAFHSWFVRVLDAVAVHVVPHPVAHSHSFEHAHQQGIVIVAKAKVDNGRRVGVRTIIRRDLIPSSYYRGQHKARVVIHRNVIRPGLEVGE